MISEAMNLKKTLRISRDDGLTLGHWFAEDPTLQIVEIPIGEADKFDPNTATKTHRAKNKFRDNAYVQRFFNRVLPMVLLYGLVVAFAAHYVGWLGGLAAVFVWAFVDLFFGTVAYREEINHARK